MKINNYYVYIYLDQNKPGRYSYNGLGFSFLYEPFYIGKGKNKRYEDHIKEAKKIKNLNIKINKENFPTTNLYKIYKILNNNCVVFKIECNLSEEKAFLLEKQLIKSIGRHDLKIGPLANMTEGGEGSTELQSNVPVVQFDLNGNFLREFSSILNAADYIKKDRSAISRACTKHSKTCGGYIWFYKSYFENKIPKILDSKTIKSLTISKRGGNKKRIVQFSTNGDYVKTFMSIDAAAKYNKLDRAYISKICKDTHKEYCKASNGFTWFFDSDFHDFKIPKKLDHDMIKKLLRNQTHNKKIIQLSIDGYIIKHWESIREASEKLNISSTQIISACSKRSKTAAGFIWEYEIR